MCHQLLAVMHSHFEVWHAATANNKICMIKFENPHTRIIASNLWKSQMSRKEAFFTDKVCFNGKCHRSEIVN